MWFAGQKIPLDGARRTREGQEVELESYGQLQQDGKLQRAVRERMVAGLSTRNYRRAVESVVEGYGIEKSSVSRQFVEASSNQLRALCERRLEDCIWWCDDRWHTWRSGVSGGLGIAESGEKHVGSVAGAETPPPPPPPRESRCTKPGASDPGAAKPYNFALSPILIKPIPDCTLVGSFSKHPEEWLNRNYIEIHTGRTVKLNGEYRGKKLKPQTLANVVWRHFLHPEAKSLRPDGKHCGAYTNGLLQRRPIEAMIPFRLIGKEIERKSQEGEDISALESTGPIEYQYGKTAKTHAADTGLIMRAKRFQDSQLRHESGKSQHAVERFLAGDRVQPSTRARLLKAAEKLERREKHSGNLVTGIR